MHDNHRLVATSTQRFDSAMVEKEKESQLTIVEGVRNVSALRARESAIKVRGSRRPRVSLDEQREIARLYADTSMSTWEICAQLGIGESSLYRILQQQGVPLRGRTGAAQKRTTRPASATSMKRKRAPAARRLAVLPVESAPPTTAGSERSGSTAPATRGRPARRNSAAQPRTLASAAALAQPSRNGNRFRIRYQGERVFEALTIQDALRQAESLGATEIMRVAREDR
jgi:transposase-like protein